MLFHLFPTPKTAVSIASIIALRVSALDTRTRTRIAVFIALGLRGVQVLQDKVCGTWTCVKAPQFSKAPRSRCFTSVGPVFGPRSKEPKSASTGSV